MDRTSGRTASRAWGVAFIVLTTVALVAYFAMPERLPGIQHILAWLRAWS